MDGGPPVFPRDSSCPAVLWIPTAISSFAYGILTLYDQLSHTVQLDSDSHDVGPYPGDLKPPVWPPPRSLATTCGISVDVFSSPYLDVSVQAVPFVLLFYS